MEGVGADGDAKRSGPEGERRVAVTAHRLAGGGDKALGEPELREIQIGEDGLLRQRRQRSGEMSGAAAHIDGRSVLLEAYTAGRCDDSLRDQIRRVGKSVKEIAAF